MKTLKEEKINVLSVKQYNKNTNAEEDVTEFVNVDVKEIDGIQTLVVEVINPVEYDIDLTKRDTILMMDFWKEAVELCEHLNNLKIPH